MEISDRKRDRTMLSFSNLGALDLLRSNSQRSSFPDVFFATLPKTQELLRNLFNGSYSNTGQNKFLIDFNKIGHDCYGWNKEGEFDDRQLSHLKFLVLACIFASQDKWGAANGHAIRAINVINRSTKNIPVKKNSKSHMTGREVQLLLAICIRMRAQKESDFDRTRKFLSDAELSLSKDFSFNPDTDLDFHKARISTQKLSTAICEYYYFRSQNPESSPDNFYTIRE